jgi:hypothetical protein
LFIQPASVVNTGDTVFRVDPPPAGQSVLFPVRFLYTATTGQVGTNESAAQHYLADRQAPSADLVAAALTWRNALPDLAPAIALLRRDMIPLYLFYIDDHIARLTELSRFDLVDAFIQWRHRITA